MSYHDIIQVIIFISFPAVIAELVKRNKIAGMIGPVLICYAVGILAGNIPHIPVNTALAQRIAEISVPIAISLLLLSTEFVKWIKYTRRTVFSFILACISVLVSSVIFTFLFAGRIDEVWKMAGMLIGVYVGGTANMSAIGLALGAKNDVFIMLNASDVVVSGIYLLMLMTIAQRLLLRFLPSFVPHTDEDRDSAFFYGRKGMDYSNKELAINFALAFLISVVILGLSVGFSMLVEGAITAGATILAVTTLGISCSFSEKIRNIPKTYEFGEYFLLIFCLSIGTMSNFTEMVKGSPEVFYYTGLLMVGSIAIHFLLAAIFRIDADTVLITSTATIFGPAFIGPVASVLKNRDIVVSGLTTALAGIAIANFLGIGTAYFLKWMLF